MLCTARMVRKRRLSVSAFQVILFVLLLMLAI